MIALVAVTPRGRAAAERLRRCLPGAVAREVGGLPEAFRDADALVLFLAVGAAVRLLAPLLGSKTSDPPVVCVDEGCRHAVSLLGGHRGGANDLCRRVAATLGARPVITTASDAAGLPASDLLGSAAGWRLVTPARSVAAALLAGRAVSLYQDAGVPVAAVDGWPAAWPDGVRRRADLAAIGDEPAIVISDRALAPRPAWAVYRPPTLAVGVGCVRGADPEAVARAAARRLASAGLAGDSVALLATLDRKADEPALVGLAAAWGVPLRTFGAAELDAQPVPHPSPVVRAAVGTGSVAEAAALLAADGGALVAPKAVCGDVTVAVARLRNRGRLSLVGLGPGDPEQLTPAARRALQASVRVLGYTGYLEPLRAWLDGPELCGYPLGAEGRRAADAVDLARAGARVALVSSGDAALYAMAGPAFAALRRRGWDGRDPVVEVLPGVTAAQAAGALLGAPLAHDHASISLSDLHTPWEEIARRLEAAAAADFALALYNPRSRRRSDHLARAAAILLRHRPPATPVGLVRNAYRAGQRVRLTTLAELAAADADMLTLVVVGSSRTWVHADRLCTAGGGAQP